MTDKKLTDKEIIKALEQCVKRGNRNYDTDLVLDLITRQQAEILRLKSMNQAKLDTIHDLQVEIEQLKEEANKYQNLWCMAIDDIEKAKSEAVKEFAEKLKEKAMQKFDWNEYVEVDEIDNLVKEMAGDDN